MGSDEQQTLVLYDIEDDRIRLRVAEACKDYGLQRIQFSAFRGDLTRNRREELWIRLSAELGDDGGRILIQPVCEKDAKEGRTILVEAKPQPLGTEAQETGEEADGN